MLCSSALHTAAVCVDVSKGQSKSSGQATPFVHHCPDESDQIQDGFHTFFIPDKKGLHLVGVSL